MVPVGVAECRPVPVGLLTQPADRGPVLTSWWPIFDELESAASGMPAGPGTVHDLFRDDNSGGVPDYACQRPSPTESLQTEHPGRGSVSDSRLTGLVSGLHGPRLSVVLLSMFALVVTGAESFGRALTRGGRGTLYLVLTFRLVWGVIECAGAVGPAGRGQCARTGGLVVAAVWLGGPRAGNLSGR